MVQCAPTAWMLGERLRRMLLWWMMPTLLPRRSGDKLMITSGTPRNNSKNTTPRRIRGRSPSVRGVTTGRELHGIQLHVRHLLLSAFLLKVLLLLLTMFHVQHLLLSPSNEIQ